MIIKQDQGSTAGPKESCAIFRRVTKIILQSHLDLNCTLSESYHQEYLTVNPRPLKTMLKVSHFSVSESVSDPKNL